MSIWWPSSRVTIAFLMSLRVYGLAARTPCVLPLTMTVLTALTLTLNRSATALAICGLGGVQRDAEHDLVGFGQRGRLFGDHRREDDVVIDAHARRSSIALTAALVSTSLSRRMMS